VSKFLIVPGLPKSGTTFLYSQLSKQTGHFNVPTERKEIDYFRRGSNYDEYVGLFNTTDEEKAFLDASPLYLDNIVENSARINECTTGHDLKFVVCIRNPLERIYSHYLHDIAQNFLIMGQGIHSIYMPSVISRYFYPLAPRVKYLLDQYGRENTLGFSFTNKNDAVENMLREFTGLSSDWQFDFNSNPSPGFTSPRVYYSETEDLNIPISGKLYVLPKKTMLLINRQFSALYRDISPRIGNNIMNNQAFLDRSFSSEELGEQSCRRIWDDYCEVLELLNMDKQDITWNQNFVSKVSNEIPDNIASKLEQAGPIGKVVDEIMESPLRASREAVINTNEPSNTLSKAMAKLENTVQKGSSDPLDIENCLDVLVNKFGPSPYYLELLIKNSLKNGNSDRVVEFLKMHPKSKGLFRPVNVHAFVPNYKKYISEDGYKQIMELA